MPRKTFKPGDQIVSIPQHVRQMIWDNKFHNLEAAYEHPAVQHGFVTSVSHEGDAFCRFFVKAHPDLLRTRSGSELVPTRYLEHYIHHPQSVIDQWLAVFEAEK